MTHAQFQKILDYVEVGKREGAELVAGGSAVKNAYGKGLFIAPTIFANVTDDMRVAREKVFGPFMVIYAFTDDKWFVKKVNNSTFGLAGAVFTKDIKQAHAVARRLEAGSESRCPLSDNVRNNTGTSRLLQRSGSTVATMQISGYLSEAVNNRALGTNWASWDC